MVFGIQGLTIWYFNLKIWEINTERYFQNYSPVISHYVLYLIDISTFLLVQFWYTFRIFQTHTWPNLRTNGITGPSKDAIVIYLVASYKITIKLYSRLACSLTWFDRYSHAEILRATKLWYWEYHGKVCYFCLCGICLTLWNCDASLLYTPDGFIELWMAIVRQEEGKEGLAGRKNYIVGEIWEEGVHRSSHINRRTRGASHSATQPSME